MADGVITQVDNATTFFLRGQEFRPETLTLAGADTLVRGTILARDSSTLKLVLYVKGGVTNGNGVPKAVLAHPVTTTGAGDVAVDVLVKGVVDKGLLVIDADGDDSNIDGAVVDELRSYGITPLPVQQLGKQDNQ